MVTSGRSAPGIGSLTPWCAPTATKTASYPWRSRPGASSTRWFRMQLDTVVEDPIDVMLQSVVRHAVFGHADAHHAAGNRKRLEDRHRVPQASEVERAGQAGRAGADDGHAVSAGLHRGGSPWGIRFVSSSRIPPAPLPIGHEPLQPHDVDRRVGLATRAGVLAAVIAHSAADRRERVVLQDRAVGIGEAAVANQRDVALGALMDRAGVAARRRAFLLDGEGVGDRLRVELVDRPALRQVLVERVRALDRAGGGAIAAARCTRRA